MPQSIYRFTILLVFQLLFLCSVSFVVGQEVLPDSPIGKRMAQLIDCINESNAEKRNKVIDTLFTDDEDPEELREIAAAIHGETGGMTLSKILRADDYDMLIRVKTKSGDLLNLRATVVKEGDNRISDVAMSEYEPEKQLEAVGDLLPLVGKDGKTIPQSRGVWLAKGYGYVIEVTEEKVSHYHFSGNIGWKTDEEMDDMELYFVAGESKDEARVTFHPKEHGFLLTRVDALPEVCKETDWTPTKLFDAFADVMTVHYPFFKERGIDWQEKIKANRPRVSDSMTENELFDVMEAMLIDLGDRHTRLIAEIDGKDRRANTGTPGTFVRLREAVAKQNEQKSKKRVARQFLSNIKKNVTEKVLDGKGKKCCQNQIVWGYVDQKVGYINIDGMGGYAIGDTDKQVAALHKALNEILTEFANTEAIIIDITTNFGGADLFSMEIASHFADKKRLGFSKWPAAVKDYRQDRYVVPFNELDPDGVVYLKPVYLLTSDLSVSAAEIFTMCMRAFPHVTTVGKPTSGALSDVLDKTLPNGWSFCTSNEIYVDHEGVCYEGPGIPPEIQIDIFDPDDVLNIVHEKLIDKVVKLALEKSGR